MGTRRVRGVHYGAMDEPVRLRVRVEGVVQGVVFRPFVYTSATRLGLAGSYPKEQLHPPTCAFLTTTERYSAAIDSTGNG